MVQLPPVTIDNDISAYYTKMPPSPTAKAGSWWFSPRSPKGGDAKAATGMRSPSRLEGHENGLDRLSLAEESPVPPSSPHEARDASPRLPRYSSVLHIQTGPWRVIHVGRWPMYVNPPLPPVC